MTGHPRITRVAMLLMATAVMDRRDSCEAAAPTVITQGASNTTVSTILPRAAVSANGIHTFAGFVYGAASYNLDGFTGLTQDMGSGLTTNTAAITLANLLQGTRYYYAGVASNTSGQVVTGAVENAVTTQVQYNYVPLGICNIDTNRPFGSEPGSVWDDVARQERTGLANALTLEHDCTGHHLDGFLQPAMIANGAVMLNALGADVLAFVAGATTNLTATLTNALFLISAVETGFTNFTLVAGSTKTNRLATINVASNTYSFVKVEADFGIWTGAGGGASFHNVQFTVPAPLTNKNYSALLNGHYLTLTTSAYLPLTLSALFAGKNTNTVTITVDLIGMTSAGATALMYDYRLWGIP